MIGNPGARFPYARYEKNPTCISVLNLPAGVPTLKRPAQYGRSQLKKILEAEEHVVVFVGESEENKGSPTTQQATRDVPESIHEPTKTGRATSPINDTHQPTHQSRVHTSANPHRQVIRPKTVSSPKRRNEISDI
jgi:hypothetical protein